MGLATVLLLVGVSIMFGSTRWHRRHRRDGYPSALNAMLWRDTDGGLIEIEDYFTVMMPVWIGMVGLLMVLLSLVGFWEELK